MREINYTQIIAGLEEITDGELWIDGQLCNYLEPKEREWLWSSRIMLFTPI